MSVVVHIITIIISIVFITTIIFIAIIPRHAAIICLPLYSLVLTAPHRYRQRPSVCK